MPFFLVVITRHNQVAPQGVFAMCFRPPPPAHSMSCASPTFRAQPPAAVFFVRRGPVSPRLTQACCHVPYGTATYCTQAVPTLTPTTPSIVCTVAARLATRTSYERSWLRSIRGSNRACLCQVSSAIPSWYKAGRGHHVRLETIGSPARGQGSNCKLCIVESACCHRCWSLGTCPHKVYFRCSSISMMAAWLPQR